MTFDLATYKPTVAWISMGALLEPHMPTYSGGLEVLTGDYLRECADRRIPMVGIIQCNGDGYFQQHFDHNDMQTERTVFWDPKSSLPRIPHSTNICYRGKDLKVGAEIYEIEGVTGFKVPVLLIDTDFLENPDADDRYILSKLYVNDSEKRIAQEYVLGRAAVKILQELGWDKSIRTIQMNEGHMWSAPLEYLEQGLTEESIREKFAFTTHTPVPAGHLLHDYGAVGRIGCGFIPANIDEYSGPGALNTTLLASFFSRHINAVSRAHKDVCDNMEVFQGYDIDYITNGIHPKTWIGKYIDPLYEKFNKHWSLDPRCLEDIMDGIRARDLVEAKMKGKMNMIPWINATSDVKFEGDALTITWARRGTPYKRPSLIFGGDGIDNLHRLADKYGPIQIIYSGKAHPGDADGKKELQDIRKLSRAVNSNVRISFINGYDAAISKRLLTGTDVWLNTPRRPEEASGTSGMKAALNGTINLSTYDGWVPEAHEKDPESVFLVGPARKQAVVSSDLEKEDAEDRKGLFESLEQIMKKRKTPAGHHDMIARSARAFPDFSTTRAIGEYAERIWKERMI